MRVPVRRPTYSPFCALYRLFDREGRLLYVGIAFVPEWRLERHNRRPWGDDINSWTVEWFPTRDAARLAEKVAIRDEVPIHNKSRPRVP